MVTHIVAPNWFHDLYLREYRAAYPHATMWGPGFLRRLRGSALIDRVLAGQTPWDDSLDRYDVRGLFTFDESVFFHRETATLIVADLLMHLTVSDELPLFTRLAFRFAGAQNRLCLFPLLRLAVTDFGSLKRTAFQVLAWKPRNVIVGHGAPLRDLGQFQLQAAFGGLVAKI